MSGLFYEETIESATGRVLADCEQFVDLAFKASDCSIIDILEDVDGQMGTFVAGGIKLYKNAKTLAMTQAKAMDKMLESLEELKKTNEELRKQNEKTQEMLRDLNRKVEKNN